MTVTELLTTLAAWGGLGFGFHSWWELHHVKLAVFPLLSAAAPEGGKNLYSAEELKKLSGEDLAAARLSLRLAIRITNMRQYPVFVESYGFCSGRWPKREYHAIKKGTYAEKYFEGMHPPCVTSPLELKPLESVTIEIQDFLPGLKNIQALNADRDVCTFARATNGYVIHADARKFFTLLLGKLSGTETVK